MTEQSRHTEINPTDQTGINITIRFFAGAAHAVGKDEIKTTALPNETLKSIVQKSSTHNLDILLDVCSFLIDGELFSGETTVAQIGKFAQLDILPPFAGG